MVEYPQKYYDILVDIRSLMFAGKEFDAKFAKFYKNKNRSKIAEMETEKILDQLIQRAKNDFIKLPAKEIRFPEIKEFMELAKAILDQFQIPEQSTRYSDSKTAFDTLNNQLINSIYNINGIKSAIAVFEREAKVWENADQKYKLFEVLRKYAKACETTLIRAIENNTQQLLSPDLVDIVAAIHSDINKNDFTPFKYKELCEKYVVSNSLRNMPDEKRFRLVITLISLKCESSNIESPAIVSIVTCPECGEKVPSGNICTKCNSYIKCPGCGHPIGKGAKLCGGCGTEIGSIDAWLGKIDEANKKISAGDYEGAEQLIGLIKTRWAKNENITTLVSTITQLRSKVAECETTVNEYITKRQYVTALRQIEENKHLLALPDTLLIKEKDIRSHIEQVRQLVRTGDKQSVAGEKADTYAQALALVADYDEAISKLTHQNIHISNLTSNVSGKQVRLSWDKLSARSFTVTYIVCREDLSNRTARIELTRTSATSFTDAIEGGISYYYSVQVAYHVSGTDVSGIWDTVTSDEILVPEEVRDTKVTVGDKSVRIEFTPVPRAVDYALYKAERSGKGARIRANLCNGSYTDTDVQNEVCYTYTLVAVFRKISGENVHSQGIEVYANPVVPPKPIKTMGVSKDGEVATLRWNGTNHTNDRFRILHSTTPVNKPIGFCMSLQDLEKSGKVFIPLTASHTECILSGRSVRNYFSVWSVFGYTVIAGAEIEVLNITEVMNPKAYISSGKLYVEWEWPQNCRQIRISYSNTGFTDPYKTVKNCPFEVYDIRKAFIIEPVTDKDYYIEIATRNFEGKQEMISSGIRLTVANSHPMTIKYTLKVSTFLKKKLTLTISNDNNSPLPDLVLVSSPNRMPARKEDGGTIYTIAQGTTCGTFELPGECIRKNYYARLFLSNVSVRNIKIITPDKERLKLY